MCICYFGFLRAGEITAPSEQAYDPGVHLNFADMAVDNKKDPSILKLSIKSSKTDPFRVGVDILVGKTSNSLAYLANQGSEEGMLFKFQDGRLLTRERFVSRVREALEAAGINHKAYSGHSLRIGVATAAGKNGLASEKIKTLGSWESSAYLLYVRISRQELAGVSKLISS